MRDVRCKRLSDIVREGIPPDYIDSQIFEPNIHIKTAINPY
jgi:hypothetical protein